MPALGELITAQLSHYLPDDVGVLEMRLVSLATGLPAHDWATTAIVQTTPNEEGPAWIYTATRASDGLALGSYQAQWRRATAPGVVWVDTEEEIELTALADFTDALVSDLRRMTGAAAETYVVNEVAYWADVQLQAVLDSNRELLHRVGTLVLTDDAGGTAKVQIRANGTFAPGVDEGQMLDSAGDAITGWTMARDGTITFPSELADAQPREFSGYVYDMHAAAADVLEAWAAAVSQHYDVSADGQSMSRSQKQAQLLKLAEWHRARELIGSVPLTSTRTAEDALWGFNRPRWSTFP